MSTHLAEHAGVWDSSAGAFISADHQRLAQVLHDYNPYFSLVWIPPADRSETDTKPFAILDSSPGCRPYIMRYLSEREMGNTQEVLSWIFEGDTSKHKASDIFSRMEARRVAGELLELKKREEELADRQEFAEFVFSDRAPHTMRHNGQTYRS